MYVLSCNLPAHHALAHSSCSRIQVNDDLTHRYLIVFASRAIADEWWRAVSTSTNAAYATTITRVTPQFYTHDPTKAIIFNTITDASVAGRFLGSVIFSLLGNRDVLVWSVIPVQNVTDHISGNWFYIRTKGDDSTYWYCTPDGRILASRTKSTRFLIRTVDPSLSPKAVMINSDNIYITLPGRRSISVSPSGDLQAAGKAEMFRFGDFLDGYSINGHGGPIFAAVHEDAIIKTGDKDGIEWELTSSGRASLSDAR
ncbi:hypothetical protein BC835DRAFT_1281963 [Cytidiella melzeri]|nr:hypothetical protein BC835DRAFT_1281963 [Cytidiella melzeri]